MRLSQESCVLVDEYGELDRKVKEFKPVTDRLKVVREEIVKLAEGQPADKSVTLEGSVYAVHLAPRKKQRKIFDKLKLFAILGKGKFLDFCSFPLEAIDRLVPQGSHSHFLTEERTGSREITAVARTVTAAKPLRKAA